jgi:hypothetical protein
MKKVKVTMLMSIAGTGDPSAASLKQKYDRMLTNLAQQSRNAQASGKPGKTDEEIEALVGAEKRKDSKIPRVSGFDHEFSFKPKDVAFIDADLAEKWQDGGICIIESEVSLKKAA